jgi:hypothetical protein
LKPYALISHSIRVQDPHPPHAETRGLGYYLKDFEDVFSRYIPKNDVSLRDNETDQRREGENDDFDPVTKDSRHDAQNGANPYGENGRHDVTGEDSGNGPAQEKKQMMDADEEGF